ncbi:MAG: cytochrome P450 [Chloroflexota bacterium]
MHHAATPNLRIASQPSVCPKTEGWPLVGAIPSLMHSSFGFFEHARKRYGDIYTLDLGFAQIIMLGHPKHAQHVLCDNAQNYVKRGPLWTNVKQLIGNGLVSSEGDFWLRQRRMMQPHFHQERLSAIAELMTEAAEEEIASWVVPSQTVDSRSTVDLMHTFNQMAMRVIVRTMFGTSLCTEQMDEIGRAISRAWDHLFLTMFGNKLPGWLPVLGGQRFQSDLETYNSAVYQIIDEQRRNPNGKNHLLALLLDAVDEESGEGMSDKQLRDEVATLFVAGFETSTIALAWSVYFLAKYPAIQRRVEEEVERVLGGRRPTFADLPHLTYTRMVLQESIRLCPPAWFTPRLAAEDDVIDGYHIPAGSNIGILKFMIHRHPDFWHQPEKFDPERFSPEHSAARHRYAWVPFGAGQRICIGREFALMEGQLTLAMFVQRFQAYPIDGYEPKLKLSGTLTTSNGIRVRLARR